jgi:hypothetical protein
MNKESLSHTLNLIFSSKEGSNSQFIPLLIKTVKSIDQRLGEGNDYFLISTSHGKRVLINQGFSPYNQLKRESFIELIDYNFSTHTLLLIGQKNPDDVVLYHWFIHYAKKEITCILQIKNKVLSSELDGIYPHIDTNKKQSMMNLFKTMIQNLQNNNILILDNETVMITASSVPHLNETTRNLIKSWRK